MRFRPAQWPLPRPVAIHHIVEDFLTDWTAPVGHILPLRRFLENCLDTDLRSFYAGKQVPKRAEGGVNTLVLVCWCVSVLVCMGLGSSTGSGKGGKEKKPRARGYQN